MLREKRFAGFAAAAAAIFLLLSPQSAAGQTELVTRKGET